MRTIAIVINGGSSVGKSTLCEALSKALLLRADGDQKRTFCKVAFDDFILHCPKQLSPRSFVGLMKGDVDQCVSKKDFDGLALFEYVDETASADAFDETAKVLKRLVFSDLGERYIKAQTEGWKRILENKVNLVIDAFLQDKAWAEDLIEVLQEFETKSGGIVISVALTCNSIVELERREKERGDRALGLARSSAKKVHKHNLMYHLKAATDEETTESIVNRILDVLREVEVE